jgi:3',5'-cyclic-nucleotide phosphodiesterase
MDYAACNVVYVDRTAREDKLVKRDDATSPGSTETPPNHAAEYAPAHPLPSPVDDNLRTLLGTFSEGMLVLSEFEQCTDTPSPYLHVWQILCLETI